MSDTQFAITIDAKELDALAKAYGTGAVLRAGVRAVNRAASHGYTLAVRDLANATGLKQRDIRGGTHGRYVALKKIPAPSTGPPDAYIRATGKPMPLILFLSRQTRTGVWASAWGVRKFYPGAFILRMKTGHRGIFTKTGKPHPRKRWRRTPTGKMRRGQSSMVRPRLPIKELWGPSLPREFEKLITIGRYSKEVLDVMQKRLLHEIGRLKRK